MPLVRTATSLVALAAALAAPAAAAASVAVSDLGPVGASGWAAVNNAGQVAGGVAPEGSGGWNGNAARWERGAPTLMPRGGTMYEGASAIDGSGRIFGSVIYAGQGGGSATAFPAFWDGSGRRETPEPNAAENTGFDDASENGNALVQFHPAKGRHALALARPPAYAYEQVPADGFPGGVNDAGHVLGVGASGPFLWTGGSSVTPVDVVPASHHALGPLDEVVGRRRLPGGGQGPPALRRPDGTITELAAPAGAPPGSTAPVAIASGGEIVGSLRHQQDGKTVEDGLLWRPDGTLVSLDTLLPPGSGWDVTEAVDVSSNGQWVLVRGHRGDPLKPHTLLLGVPRPELSVTLTATELPGSDVLEVVVAAENTGNAPLTGITATAGGLRVVPGVFASDPGEVALVRTSGAPFPGTLEPGARATRTWTYLTTQAGRVLLQAELRGGEVTRDAEYAELRIETAPPGPLQRMAVVEAVSTVAHNLVIAASERWAKRRVKQMQQLPPRVRRQWLGATKDGEVHGISSWERASAHLHGLSPQELATQVPQRPVVRKGGAARIAAARRAVAAAPTPRLEARASVRFERTKRRETLTSSESMAIYNRERMLADNDELWRIYEEYGEQAAKGLYANGGGAWRAMLNLGSYEGRQQLQADLVRFAELNDESFRDTLLTAKDPAKAFTEAVAVFNENVEEAEVARAKREQFKRDLYISDPEHAISVQARDDSAYLATILRGYIELFDPTPGPVEVLTWAGKRATTGVSRSSVMMAKATQEGDKLAGARIMHGADDLGEGVRHADDFMFPSADPSELARLDQLGRKGGAGMRDQRIAEQINREVTEDLRRAFPEQEGIEFAMSYRPKKDYDPIGSLPKPQAFGEKTLDPRSIQVLGAPESGLGKLVIFKPEHPLRTKGWDKLPAVQKRADLELYKLHLDQWTNFHKRNPAGKTGQWKQAIGERKKLDFGGGHSVEMELEAHKLAPNAIEIRAKHLSIDGTQIHKGRPASIGGDLDPLIAVDARTGKKLEGEMERFALESWNRRAVQAQKDFGFRSGGHGATAHGDDVTPRQWTSFAKYAAVHLTPAEQLRFEALVVKRAGLPAGTKILPAGLKADEHLLRTTISDSFVGPLGQVFD